MNLLHSTFRYFVWLALAALVFGAGSGQKKLKPEYEQFLSEVRYIITSEIGRAHV